jgi:hypothetical protein
MNGLRRSSILGKKARHLVLTTSNDSRVKGNSQQLYEDYQKLKRLTPLKLLQTGYILPDDLRRYYPNKPLNEPLEYEYHRIRTNEGNNVLHLITVGDFIPRYWLVDQWDTLHESPNISITEISNTNYGQRAKYVVTQYVSDQKSSYVRSSMSKNFIYPNWRSDYEQLKYLTYHKGIKHAYRKSKFSNWHYEWYTESERYEQKLDRGKYQTRFSPVVIPSDKYLLLNKWEKLLDSKLTSQSGGCYDETSSGSSRQPPPRSI